jgi:ribulose bisphosphate carboxylase small subunit
MGKYNAFYQRSAHRSGLEDLIDKQLRQLQDSGYKFKFTFEEDVLEYKRKRQGKLECQECGHMNELFTEHTYTPDFHIFLPDGREFFIETKGRWESKDRTKHKEVRKQHPNVEIRFIFCDPNGRTQKGVKKKFDNWMKDTTDEDRDAFLERYRIAKVPRLTPYLFWSQERNLTYATWAMKNLGTPEDHIAKDVCPVEWLV